MADFDLGACYFNESLCDWVILIHATLIKKFKLTQFKIEPNDYGFDSYAAIIDTIMRQVLPDEIIGSIKGGPNIAKYIQPMHTAWCNNYIRWKQIQPEAAGKNPKKSLNTANRNNRATTIIDHLEQDDLDLYQDLLVVVFELLTKKLLEAGLQQLTI
jgi:hypothetical protein